ncbi:MAG: glycine cleavage system aminomethyltransferase GcvT [Phycisphaeraceae bacterium]|nr:MAG: glycine cleavage system aminomethyltransferase GcvT [Phycisphaeraceae bacterium]
MQRTPLHDFHVEYGAKMVDFAGWEMPIYYSGIHEEHHQVRSSGGLFDVSHMGRLRFTGRHARRLLERLCTRRIGDMSQGQCRYSLMCNESGGVRDDVIVMRVEEDDFLVVVNGANREKIVGHVEKVRAADNLVAKVSDDTLSSAMVALQGPKVMELISRVSSEVPTLKRYRFAIKNLVIAKLIVSRTGYTGEDGVEVILPAGMVGLAMKLLLKDVNMKEAEARVKPAGLGARDTLRLEASMPLYGHELGEEINALSCGVDFAIAMDKDKEEGGLPFVGQDALRRTRDEGGPRSKLVGIEIEGRRTARQGNAVLVAGRGVGTVTSACLSPTLGKPIAMAFLETAAVADGAGVQIDTGRGVLEGRLVPMPFYKAPKQ